MSRPRLGWTLLLLVGLLAAWVVAGEGRKIDHARGTITKVTDEWYGIVPDEDPGTRYAPDHLPEDFRVDGLRVVFSGEVAEIPPTGRRWGTPLKLTDIRRLEE